MAIAPRIGMKRSRIAVDQDIARRGHCPWKLDLDRIRNALREKDLLPSLRTIRAAIAAQVQGSCH
jgi:hypothetical protein